MGHFGSRPVRMAMKCASDSSTSSGDRAITMSRCPNVSVPLRHPLCSAHRHVNDAKHPLGPQQVITELSMSSCLCPTAPQRCHFDAPESTMQL